MTATQVKHPNRATVRTVVQTLVGFAVLAPTIYHEITQHDPAAATGAAAGALAISAAITRIMAIPQVDAFLARFGLAAAPKPAAPPETPGSVAP